MSELQGLQSRITDLRGNGTRVLAISPDSVEQNDEVIGWLGLDFPILSDSELAATDAFGLRHADAAPGGGDVPRPATYILESGTIRWRNLTDNWRIRPRASDLVETLTTLAAGTSADVPLPLEPTP